MWHKWILYESLLKLHIFIFGHDSDYITFYFHRVIYDQNRIHLNIHRRERHPPRIYALFVTCSDTPNHFVEQLKRNSPTSIIKVRTVLEKLADQNLTRWMKRVACVCLLVFFYRLTLDSVCGKVAIFTH